MFDDDYVAIFEKVWCVFQTMGNSDYREIKTDEGKKRDNMWWKRLILDQRKLWFSETIILRSEVIAYVLNSWFKRIKMIKFKGESVFVKESCDTIKIIEEFGDVVKIKYNAIYNTE